MNLQELTNPAQSGAPDVVNENFETLEAVAVYGKRQPATSGLVWGYCGGRWGGFAITAGTLTLTANAINDVVVEIATGIISVGIFDSPGTSNWNDANYLRVYRITTDGSGVDTVEDHRAGPGGILSGGSGTASSSQPGEFMSGYISAPVAKTYRVVVKASHGGEITETTTIAESGTGTATFKISGVSLGGSANAVSTAEQSQAHASANVFVAGDDIEITMSSLSSLVGMSFTIKYTRTLA